jgi:hypothetical protein
MCLIMSATTLRMSKILTVDSIEERIRIGKLRASSNIFCVYFGVFLALAHNMDESADHSILNPDGSNDAVSVKEVPLGWHCYKMTPRVQTPEKS